eukprot:m.951276 g.951276  ORF g.951276 m.951276 type:complete len:51 (+) comp23866_c0_seq1:209-361(+)
MFACLLLRGANNACVFTIKVATRVQLVLLGDASRDMECGTLSKGVVCYSA